MRAIFCGNLEYDARQSEVERLFRKYGRVERVDMKSGFAFVYMEDERDADDAVRRLDRIEFGRKGRRLWVEWTKQERDSRRSVGGRKPAANDRPSKTLFVINFDPIYTKSKDLERHFEPYGRIANIRIRRNFAFIQYENLEDATRALEATNMSKVMDRVITVEYAIRDDDRGNGRSPDRRGRDLSPERGVYDRRRSPSPHRRERGSPDYGYRREKGSPDYGRGTRLEARGSPDYGRHESPSNGRRYDSRSPPPRGRSISSRSPPLRERSRPSRSPPLRERSRSSRSPPQRERPRSSLSPPPPERSRSSRSPPPRSPPSHERSRYSHSPPPHSPAALSPPPRKRSRSSRSPPRERSRS